MHIMSTHFLEPCNIIPPVSLTIVNLCIYTPGSTHAGLKSWVHMSCVMRKPAFGINVYAKTKVLISTFVFRYIDSSIPFLRGIRGIVLSM